MAITPITRRPGRAVAVAMRPEDRFDYPTIEPDRSSVTAWLVGTAIVAGSVVGLLLYDSERPIASGALAVMPALVISVDPLPNDPQAQPR